MLFSSLPEYSIPVIIFLARICDVSIGTVRIIFVARGMRFRASLLGFVEVFIWIIVVAQLIQHLNYWPNYVAYAGGFAAGTWLGITFENRIKVGTILIRVITNADAGGLIDKLQESGFMMTRVEAKGGQGPVEIIFMVLKRKRWNDAVQIIESYDENVFYSIEDVKYTSRETSGVLGLPVSRSIFDRLLRVRKGI